MIALLELALIVLALPALAAAGYLALLALAARPGPAAPCGSTGWRIAVVVPAHDEQALIGATVASLLALEYPAAKRRVIVVADNCTDDTVDRAQAAGAEVFVRHDPSRRGKGFALAFAFDRLLAEGWAHAVVVVDADTVVSPNLLCAFAARLDRGAQAVQAHYGARNPGASWRTRLMDVALALFHGARSAGRERLGLSCGLRGNGMCFRADLLARVPHRAFSVVEDLEYGLDLAEAGVRVHYAPEAHVLGEMAARGAAAATQRQRWEGGRRALARTRAPRLVREALARRDRVRLDLALDLLVPPLTRLGVMCALGTAAALAARSEQAGAAATVAVALWAASLALLAAYVLRGWQLSGTGARGALALLGAPAFLLWKFSLVARRRRRGREEWVRTTRESEVV